MERRSYLMDLLVNNINCILPQLDEPLQNNYDVFGVNGHESA